MRQRLVHVMIVAAVSSAMYAQQTSTSWQGTYKDAGELHRVVVQGDETATGQWTVRQMYVDFLPEAIKIDSSQMVDSHLKLASNGGKGILPGLLAQAVPGLKLASNGGKGILAATLDGGGRELDGTWTWAGKSVPIALRRVSGEEAWHVPLQYQYHLDGVTYDRPAPDEPRIPFSPRLAVDYMEQGAMAWTREGQCVACHTNGTHMVVRPLMTPELGAPQQALRDYFVSTLRDALKSDSARSGSEVEPTQIVYVAAGLAIWDAHVLHHLSPETTQALELMFKLQQPAGDWVIEDDNNPPLESSRYQLATVAARAVANAPGWLGQQHGTALEARVNLLKKYLREPKKLQGDYDRTDLLWTASEYPGLINEAKKRELMEIVFGHQQFDGGWSIRTFAMPEEWGKGNRASKLRSELEFPFPQSDGHMTALAIIALRKAGVPASDPRIQRGVAWLLDNQRSSGRWWTRSLNRDGWQFISYSGTAYPLLALALCNALPARLPAMPSGS